jgi:hypothetical protein
MLLWPSTFTQRQKFRPFVPFAVTGKGMPKITEKSEVATVILHNNLRHVGRPPCRKSPVCSCVPGMAWLNFGVHLLAFNHVLLYGY